MATKQEAVPEVPAKEVNHHIAIALRHLNERRKALLEKWAQQITAEIEELGRGDPGAGVTKMKEAEIKVPEGMERAAFSEPCRYQV